MKIALIHAGFRSYRNKLFTLLHKNFNIKFLLYGFYMPGHPLTKGEWVKESRKQKWKYEILFNKIRFFYRYVTPTLLWKVPKYDLIITSDPLSFATHFSFPLAKLFNKKIILWGETWIYPETKSAKFIQPYVRHIIRNVDAVIVAGRKSKEWFISQGAREENIFIAKNCSLPLETSTTRQQKEIIKKHGLERKKIVLYLGRIVKYKGLDTLIKAFATVRKKDKDAFLLIIGSETEFGAECRELAKKLPKESYLFLGHINHKESIPYREISDVFVLPARFRPKDIVPAEAWGLTINEMMSIGKPIVTTTAVAAGYDLIINGENGFQIEPDKPKELAHAISESLVHRKSFGKKSKELFTTWNSYEDQFEGFRKVINHVKK